MASRQDASNLMSRSPGSRKSLSVAQPSSGAPRARQRAKSIATANPDDDLTPRKKLRRSLQPKRSILKQSNIMGEDGSTNNTVFNLAPHGATDEFTLNITRASSTGLDRRVSFAPNAHVRVFEVKEQNTNGSSTPPSSPSVEIESPDAPHVLVQSPSSQVTSGKRYRPSRRSSLRNSIGGSDDAVDMEIESDVSCVEDQSMDLTNNSITASEEDSQTYQASPQDEEQDDEDDDGGSVDMDITMNTNPASRRQSRASAVSRRRSSRRLSTAPSNADTSGEPMEFTIALGNRVKGEVKPAPEWYALQQLVTGRNDRDDPPPPEADAESSNPNDIDLQSAMQRMIAAGAGIVQQSSHVADDVSVSSVSSNSGEESMDMGDKTMDITKITGGIRRASTTQRVLSKSLDLPLGSSPPKPVLSVFSSQATLPGNVLFTPKPQASTSAFQVPLNPVTPVGASVTTTGPVSALKAQSKLPVFNKTPVYSGAESPALPSGGTVKPKPTPPVFTAAFALPSTPKAPGRTNLKRPFSVEGGEKAVGSPAKKIVVPGEGGIGTKGVPVVPTPTKIPRANRSPVKSPAKTPSRTVGSPLKRLGGSATARRASLRRASLATPKPPTPRKEPVPTSTTAPLVFPPPALPNIQGNVSTPSRNKPRTPSPSCASIVTAAPPPPAVEVTPRTYAREEARQATAPIVPATSPIRSPVRPALAELPPSSAPVSPGAPLIPASPWSKFSRGRTSSYAPSQINEYTYDTGVYTISESGEEVDVPKLSLEEFLEITGVTFMDNMTAHRRSTMALQSSRDPNVGPPTIADFAEAIAIEYPLLVHYDSLANLLQDQTAVYEDRLQEIEDDVRENTPTVFAEYHRADPESQAEIRDVLHRCKTLSRTQVKTSWYKFKHSRVEQLCDELADKKEKVAADLQLLASTHEEVDPLLKTFEERYPNLTSSLEQEKAEVAELAKCDPAALDEVKGTVTEQQMEVDALSAEVALLEKDLAEVEQQIAAAKAEESNLYHREEVANRILSIQEVDPEEELARAQQHVELLHLVGRWEATKISPDRVVFEYDRRIILNMPCSHFKPILSSCTLSDKPVYVKGKPYVDYCPIPEFTAYTMDCARRAVAAGRFGSTTKKIVKSLTKFWTACTEIREEILMLQCKYAVEFHNEGNALRVEVPLLYMKTMAKVLLDFTFDEKCIRRWPLTLPAIRFETHLGYTLDGKDINMEDVDRTARDRIAQATLAEHYGTLVDACADVADLYE